MTEEQPAAEQPADPPAGRGEKRGRERQKQRSRSRATVFSVIGELLITGGVVVLLFIAWQLWWNDWITASQQTEAASSQSQEWIEQSRATEKPAATDPATDAPTTEAPAEDFGDPAVLASVSAGKSFGILYVPRFGADYQRNIAEGVGTDVLNSTKLGIGHYPDTQLPGEVGNFAIASHRSAYGGGMHVLNELQLGDPIIVQTADGWYTYRFRNLQYVHPSQVEVLDPVPGQDAATPTDRLITLTTCNPLLSTAERIIAYGVFESWRPTSAGPPAEIAQQIAEQAKGA